MDYRSALITGASSGIGAAFARVLPPGTNLVLTGRDTAALDALARELARPGRSIATVAADLAADAGRDAVIRAGEAAAIDLLVNNAGLGYFGLVPRNRPEDERAMVEVNVMTPVVLTRALLPGMLGRAKAANRRAGVIVVSSISAFLPVSRLATYAASKAFDLHYAEALAADLEAEPCDVVALCPGFTRTKFGERSGMKPWMFHGAASPERVAQAGLDALGRRRTVVIGSGAIMAPLGARLLPRRWMSSGVVAAMKRLKQKSGM
ncbi:MAG: SDR family NAD(P)-dependent oxidoreductase [Alphaproteobacteria bacterium]|nr:SDR family NAD(P)-dependent oxidoreductase [Alphaproteobacteria bacterium]